MEIEVKFVLSFEMENGFWKNMEGDIKEVLRIEVNYFVKKKWVEEVEIVL